MPAEERIHHVPYDLNYHAKQHGSALLDSLVPLLDAYLDVTGVLVHTPSAGPQVATLHLRLSMCSLIMQTVLQPARDSGHMPLLAMQLSYVPQWLRKRQVAHLGAVVAEPHVSWRPAGGAAGRAAHQLHRLPGPHQRRAGVPWARTPKPCVSYGRLCTASTTCIGDAAAAAAFHCRRAEHACRNHRACWGASTWSMCCSGRACCRRAQRCRPRTPRCAQPLV